MTEIRGALYRASLSLLVILAMGTAVAEQRSVFPPKLEKYFNSVGALSRGEREQLLAGQPITKLLDADASKARHRACPASLEESEHPPGWGILTRALSMLRVPWLLKMRSTRS
jgi:hypothetical protein